MLEHPIIFMFTFFTIGVPTFLIAAFATLFGHQDYVVADKKIAKNDVSSWDDKFMVIIFFIWNF